MAHNVARGGVAVTTIVGECGEGVRSDAQVRVTSSAVLKVAVRSTVDSMYGDSIRREVEESLKAFGHPTVDLEVDDAGALPFVLRARLHSALAQHLDVPIPKLDPRKREVHRDRPRRTRLYLPGNVPKYFPNAALFHADGLILDLEDSVSEEHKRAARTLVAHTLAALDFGTSEPIVRINSGEAGLDDVAVLSHLGVGAFLVPKVESGEDLSLIAAILDSSGVDTLLIPLVESALGAENAFEIARAHDRVVAIAIGLEDYLTDIGAERTAEGQESLWLRGRIANAAHAAGIAPLASVFPNIDDDEALHAYAEQARRMGFQGVGCVHPRQIKIVHRAFAPSAEELAYAEAMVIAFEQGGKGVVKVGGKMVDAPVYQRAKATVARAAQ